MGNGTSWSDPKNWSSDALPGAADDVTINVSSPITITRATGTDTIHSLNSTNSQVNFDLTGGSLSIGSNSTPTTSTIAGAFANSGLLEVAGGNLDLNGGVTSTGGQFLVDSGAELGFGGVVS